MNPPRRLAIFGIVVVAVIAVVASLVYVVHMPQPLPDRLVVTRTKNNLNNPFEPPFNQTISDHAVVQEIYRDILALPSFPNGTTSCPPDFGIAYALDFYASNTLVLRASYKPTSCPSVALGDTSLKSAQGSSLEDDLQRALDLSDGEFFGYQ